MITGLPSVVRHLRPSWVPKDVSLEVDMYASEGGIRIVAHRNEFGPTARFGYADVDAIALTRAQRAGLEDVAVSLLRDAIVQALARAGVSPMRRQSGVSARGKWRARLVYRPEAR